MKNKTLIQLLLLLSLIAITVVIVATGQLNIDSNSGSIKKSERKTTLLIKLREDFISKDLYTHFVDDIPYKDLKDILQKYDVKEFRSVFKNRYDENGKIKEALISNRKLLEGWFEFTLKGDFDPKRCIAELNELRDVKLVKIDTPIPIIPSASPNDAEYGSQWHLNNPSNPTFDIDAEAAWDINTGRSDVIIAVLDGGVDYTHSDLDPGDRSRIIAGIDTGDDDNDPMDNLPDNTEGSFAGHGTKIAGVIGARTDNGQQVAGVMWNCSIMPVKMVRNGGIRFPYTNQTVWDWSITVFPSDAADAIDYAVNQGANIITLSYGFPDLGWPINDIILQVPLLHDALENAYQNNVIITCSMGNDFLTNNVTYYPAGFDQVIAVGATDPDGSRRGTSNTGPHIDLAAPGTNIHTTVRGGGTTTSGVSGTSYSSPMVAAVAGLVISQGKDRNFNLTNDDVKHILELTATDVSSPGFDNETGHGIVNAHNALQLINEPNVLYHGNSVGGTSSLIQTFSSWVLLDNRWGIAAGTYLSVDQYKITKHVTFENSFCSPPTVWMRERQSKGLSLAVPNDGRPYSKITNITQTGFDLEYYTYYVRYNVLSQQINKWIPASPSSTNVAYTAVGVPDPASVSGEIIGASVVCNSETYRIDNLPAGATVTWSSSWNSPPYPTLVQNSPNLNECTINNTYQYPSSTTLTATITGCGTPKIVTKIIGSDYSNPTQYGSYSQQACWVNGLLQPALSGSLPSNPYSATYLHQGCPAEITLSQMGGKTVTYVGSPPPAPQPTFWYYNSSTSKLTVQLPLGSGGVPFTFKISGEGVCQDKTRVFFSYLTYYSYYSYSISPNPTSDVLTINAELKSREGTEEAKINENFQNELEYTINIHDQSTGELVHSQKSKKGELLQKINVSRLRKGLYTIQIIEKGSVQTLRFLKE